jgi:hypothetical protein
MARTTDADTLAMRAGESAYLQFCKRHAQTRSHTQHDGHANAKCKRPSEAVMSRALSDFLSLTHIVGLLKRVGESQQQRL